MNLGYMLIFLVWGVSTGVLGRYLFNMQKIINAFHAHDLRADHEHSLYDALAAHRRQWWTVGIYGGICVVLGGFVAWLHYS